MIDGFPDVLMCAEENQGNAFFYIRHALDVVTYKSVKVVPWSIEFNVDGPF